MSQHLQLETEAKKKPSEVKFVHPALYLVFYVSIKLFCLSVLTVICNTLPHIQLTSRYVCLGQNQSILTVQVAACSVLACTLTP